MKKYDQIRTPHIISGIHKNLYDSISYNRLNHI